MPLIMKICLLVVFIAGFAVSGISYAAETTTQDYLRTITQPKSDFFSPERLFDSFKRNITIPVPFGGKIELPQPQRALEDAAPKLREINRDIREETGIDFAKFIGWAAEMLRIFFAVVVNLMEKVAGSLAD